ncbi:hypothetical protein BESB_074510 [Besnoitia besnoiti]|uniref:Transmembrane protein n=1 Tax=Besnoitia besnoiti TaxID=94643 RepID=A0A2A9M8R3_BESBE|nr:uncharacterized protein BESB_074510 [Besnoitia besnoiti]PFH34299.1 hypothetical protein BESB_074510 [Besnoitia besnoiti]
MERATRLAVGCILVSFSLFSCSLSSSPRWPAAVWALRPPSSSPLATIPAPPHLPGVHTPAPPPARSHITSSSHSSSLSSPSASAKTSLTHYGSSAEDAGSGSAASSSPVRDAARRPWSGVDTPAAVETPGGAREQGAQEQSSFDSTPQSFPSLWSQLDTQLSAAHAEGQGEVKPAGSSPLSRNSLSATSITRRRVASFSTLVPTPPDMSALPVQGLLQASSDPDEGWGVQLSLRGALSSFPSSPIFSLHTRASRAAPSEETAKDATSADPCASPPVARESPTLASPAEDAEERARSARARGGAAQRIYSVSFSAPTDELWGQDVVVCMNWAQPQPSASLSDSASPADPLPPADLASASTALPGVDGERQSAPAEAAAGRRPEAADARAAKTVSVAVAFGHVPDACAWGRKGSEGQKTRGRAECEKPQVELGGGRAGGQRPQGEASAASAETAEGVVHREGEDRGGRAATRGDARQLQGASSLSVLHVLHAAPTAMSLDGNYDVNFLLPLRLMPPVTSHALWGHSRAPRRSPEDREAEREAGSGSPLGGRNAAGVAERSPTSAADTQRDLASSSMEISSSDADSANLCASSASGRRRHTGRRIGESHNTGAGVLLGSMCRGPGDEVEETLSDSLERRPRGRLDAAGEEAEDRAGRAMRGGARLAHDEAARQGAGGLVGTADASAGISAPLTKSAMKAALSSALLVVKPQLSGGCDGHFASQTLALTPLRPYLGSRGPSEPRRRVEAGWVEREKQEGVSPARARGDEEAEAVEAELRDEEGDAFLDIAVPLSLSVRGEDLPVDLALCLYTSRLDTHPLAFGAVHLGAPPPIGAEALAQLPLASPASGEAEANRAHAAKCVGPEGLAPKAADAKEAGETQQVEPAGAQGGGSAWTVDSPSVPEKVLSWLARQVAHLNFMRRRPHAETVGTVGPAEGAERTAVEGHGKEASSVRGEPAAADSTAVGAAEEGWWSRVTAFVASPLGGAPDSRGSTETEGSGDAASAEDDQAGAEGEQEHRTQFGAPAARWLLYLPFAVFVGSVCGYLLTLHWQARAKLREARAKTCNGPCCSEAPSDLMAIRSSLRAASAMTCGSVSSSSPFLPLSSFGDRLAWGRRAERGAAPGSSAASQAAFLSCGEALFSSTSSASSRASRKSSHGSSRRSRKARHPPAYVTPSRRIYETLWGGEAEERDDARREEDPERRSLLAGADAWHWADDEGTASGRRRGRRERRAARENDVTRWQISY